MTIERITFFHSNDVHSYFSNWSQIVAYIKQNRDENTLYFELGDHTDRSAPLTEASYGRDNIALLNEAGVDYATIGNNEGITFSKEHLDRLYDEATFPVVVANLYHPNGKRPRWAKSYSIHTLQSGTTVGIIGLTAPFTQFYEQLGWVVTSPKEKLKELLPTIREQADIVVLMSHLGLPSDQEIASEFDEIDVILGAHTHHVLQTGRKVRNSLIAQAGKHGAYLGQITIEFEQNERRIMRSFANLLDVSKKVTDPKTDQLLHQMNEKAKERLSKRVATIPRRLPVIWQEETEVTRLLCDALTEWCNEELAMLNTGVLLDTIEAGEVTKGDIHRICPHPINPCVITVTGHQLARTIERAHTKEITNLELKGFGFRGKVIGKMLFTGITFQLENHRPVQIEVLGKPLQLDQLYKMATLDMYTFGYLFPDLAEAKDTIYYMPEFLRDVLTWKLAEKWA